MFENNVLHKCREQAQTSMEIIEALEKHLDTLEDQIYQTTRKAISQHNEQQMV